MSVNIESKQRESTSFSVYCAGRGVRQTECLLGYDQRGCKHTLKMLSILMMVFADVTFVLVEMPGID